MRKIAFCFLFVFSASSLFAVIGEDHMDKDNMEDLIDGVSSVRAGTDRLQVIYDFAPMLDNSMPLKLGVALLDLTTIADDIDGINRATLSPTEVADVLQGNLSLTDDYLSFLPKGFVGLSFYDFALAYQFDLDNRGHLGGGIDAIASSHSLSFGVSMRDFYLSAPFSVAVGNSPYFDGKLAFSMTPTFTLLFRGGFVKDFQVLLHYGASFAGSTNDSPDKVPMSLGFGLRTQVMLTDFSTSSLQISFPLEFDFRYGIGSRLADFDAGYADVLDTNPLYDETGEVSTDSIYFGIVLPVKLEARLGAIYVYGMPKIFSQVFVYKTDVNFRVSYGMEAALEFTPLENLTIGLKGYTGGSTVTQEEDRIGLDSSFDADLDIYGVWRF